MGSLLVTILLGYRRLSQQVKHAAVRLEGVAAAEFVLKSWADQPGFGPAEPEGVIPEFPGWQWRYDSYSPPELAYVDASIGRLDVFRRVDPRDGGDDIHVTVDVLASGADQRATTFGNNRL
jgi:hypothetical protein